MLEGRGRSDATQASAPNAPGGAVLFSSRADTFAGALKIYSQLNKGVVTEGRPVA